MSNEREELADRKAFIEAHGNLDFVEMNDAWGRPMFKHTHIEAMWVGWRKGRATLRISLAATPWPVDNPLARYTVEQLSFEIAKRTVVSRPEPAATAGSDDLAAVHKALFEPHESDAIDNLEGALIDIKRLSEQGKPTDQVCIRTLERIQAQLVAAHALVSRPEPAATPVTDIVREALEIAEDVLARRPFSSEIWSNGMHPQTGITKIRAALALVSRPEHQTPNGERQ